MWSFSSHFSCFLQATQSADKKKCDNKNAISKASRAQQQMAAKGNNLLLQRLPYKDVREWATGKQAVTDLGLKQPGLIQHTSKEQAGLQM